MIRKIKISIVSAITACVMFSCAQEKDESTNDIQKRILDAYVAEYYPSAEKMPNGLVYLNRKAGSGEILKKYDAAYVEFTTKTLEGIYTATSDSEIAKMLGTYSKTTYYGPKLYEVGYGTTYTGIEDMLIGMQPGGEATAIIPPWLTGTEYSSGSQGSSSNMIYTFKLKHIITDIIKFQMDTMAAYAKIHYPGLDTTSKGYYFKKLYEGSNDTIANDASINVRYVGRFLDGFIFDTNIADTAKKYGIYNSSNEYKPMNVTMSADIKTMSEASQGLRLGVCMAIKQMNYKDRAFTMFYSNLGYGAEGSGDIGKYQPLIFYLYVEPKEKE
ncbi:MAG: hypothetical protein RR880_04745 [Bacteroidales bacterium]